MINIDLDASIRSRGVWDGAFVQSITLPLKSYLLQTTLNTAGLLVEGQLGSGKSFLLRAVNDSLGDAIINTSINLKVVYVDFLAAVESYTSGESESMLLGLFFMCNKGERRVLLFDNLDSLGLLPQRLRKSMYSALLVALAKGSGADRAFVIATVSSSSKLPVEFMGTSRLSPPLVLRNPTTLLRKTLLFTLLSNESICIVNKEGVAEGAVDELSNMIARKTSGYLAADLVELVRDMYQRQLIQQEGSVADTTKITITYDFALRMLDRSLPTSMLANKSIFSDLPSCDSDSASAPVLDPVGIDDTLLSLRSDVLRPFLDPAGLLGTRPCSGILICGPSGCGKTYLAEWIASRGSAVFRKIVVPCADLVNKVVGESERKIASVFKMARELSPCFVIFDNLDIILGSASHGEGQPFGGKRTAHKALDRTLSTLLVEIDGISPTDNAAEGDSKPRVVVVATSSNFDAIDRALKRPGRLEHHVELSLPSEQQRHELIASTIASMCGVSAASLLDGGDEALLQERSVLKRLARATFCKSHAEIVQIIRNACYGLLRLHIRGGGEDSMSHDGALLREICRYLETVSL